MPTRTPTPNAESIRSLMVSFFCGHLCRLLFHCFPMCLANRHVNGVAGGCTCEAIAQVRVAAAWTTLKLVSFLRESRAKNDTTELCRARPECFELLLMAAVDY